MEPPTFISRKEKRKALKKDKRKQIRKELAEKARAEEEARLNDPDELRKIEIQEQIEKELLDKQRKDFVERERIFLQTKKKEQQEEEERNAAQIESNRKQEGGEESLDDDNEWEYVEEGPPEIIWQGNEIIVKKNKVRVKKKQTNHDVEKEDPNRPTSNPLPPQSEAYAAHKNAPMKSAELLDTVAQQFPNFGTEQDKSHCPFHIKTGACRFGLRCNRVHYYPDKSTTLLIKTMYNGPGLAWEQDEGLEVCCWIQPVILNLSRDPQWRTCRCTDEEVERSYEEFYEDVHTEFLKFGELINFKVCRNGSFHLRGNVYVHYKSLDSAVMAFNSVHGRYFAGKQVTCEFVSLTRWKIAICGEYMKSRLKTCSRGSACNFLHCFSNPGGDYEWADFDKPPPRFWAKKMIALFGYSDELSHEKQIEQPSPKDQQHSSRIFTSDSYHNKRHRSLETNQHNGSSSHREESFVRKSRRHERQKEKTSYEDSIEYKNDTDSAGDQFDRRHGEGSEKRSRHNDRRESRSNGRSRRTSHGSSSDEDLYTKRRQDHTRPRSRHRKKVLESSNGDEESDDAKHKLDEIELQRYKEQKTNSSSRSVRQNRDDERSAKKQKREHIKPATDTHSRHRHDRSISRDCDGTYLLGKNDTSDRWEPDTSPSERKPKVRRSSRERSVEDESKNLQGVGKNRHYKTTKEKR